MKWVKLKCDLVLEQVRLLESRKERDKILTQTADSMLVDIIRH